MWSAARRLGRADSSTRLGRKPASVLPAPVGAISSAERPASAWASSSIWWGRGAQPRPANQPRKAGGRAARGSAAKGWAAGGGGGEGSGGVLSSTPTT